MKFSKIVLTIIFSTTIITSNAQQNTYPTAIGIGDLLPQIKIDKVFPGSLSVNDTRKEYKKGIVIINFWASWCVPCVKELQLLAEMRKKYPGKLSILSVTHENSVITKAFLQRHKEIDISALTIINDDKHFSALFPHRFLPHNIWIDSNGKVRAISGGEEISRINIESAINSGQFPQNLKADNLHFDYTKAYTPNDTLYLYRSSLSRGAEGIGAGIVVKKAEENTTRDRIFGWNCSIAQLYWMTYFNELNASPTADYSLITMRSKDSLKLREPKDIKRSGYDSKKAWRIENTYSYELKYKKPVPQDTAFFQMRNDLNRNFKYKTFLELAERDVLILKSDKKVQISLGGKKTFEASENGIKVRNMTIKDLIGQLNGIFTIKNPIIDETDFTQKVDIDIINPTPERGFNFLNSLSLWEKSGLKFTTGKRMVKTLVIADK